MSWTDERVELLRRMWGEGRTAAEIAGELGGITRNAVIGKAHRLKLSGRVSPIASATTTSATAATAALKIAQPLSLPQPANRDKPPAVASPPRLQPSMPASAIKIRNEGVKMADLRDRMCRWPFGDPKHADFHFCGCASAPGMPYCPDHSRAAYQVARNRTLAPEDFEGQPAHVDEDKEAVG